MVNPALDEATLKPKIEQARKAAEIANITIIEKPTLNCIRINVC